ncbi:MAG: hypothetical protein AAFY88_32310, partial [Acidobacteriota bacterium]
MLLMKSARIARVLCRHATWMLVALCPAPSLLAEGPPVEFQAPTRLFQAPAIDSLATLPGDFVEMQYTLGALDRAARLQTRINEMLRRGDAAFQITVYVLNRDQWASARFNMPYGIPVRVGPSGLAVPASGDSGTAKLWNDLQLPLPSAPGIVYRGGPGHAPSELMADIVALALAGEIYADLTRLAGDEFWLRGLVSHLVALDYMRRAEPEFKLELDVLYRQIRGERPARSLAASDYRADISMRDWIWFQAQFHEGALAVIEEEGRGVRRRLEKIRKRNSGVVTATAALGRWDTLRAWYGERWPRSSRRT